MHIIDERIDPEDLAAALEAVSSRVVGAIRSGHYDVSKRACELLRLSALVAVVTWETEAQAQRHVMASAVGGLEDVLDLLWSLNHPDSPFAIALPKADDSEVE